MTTILVAMFQGQAKLKDLHCNLTKMREQTLKAKEAGAQIIVFPELFLTGYHLEAEDMKSLAQESNGEAFQELSLLAKETGVCILYGYPEREQTDQGMRYFNSAQLIGQDGHSLINHRKAHLWIDQGGHERVFTPSTGLSELTDCCGFKIGVLICYDVEFPEAVRTLVMKGANLLLVPAATTDEIEVISKHMVPTRAHENAVHVVYVNHKEAGLSVCCDVTGETIVRAQGYKEELVMAAIRRVGENKSVHLRDRRPELYQN